MENFEQIFGNNDAFLALMRGDMSAEQYMGAMAKLGLKMTPEQESYLESMLANQRTNEARDYETNMANTDLLRAASQLSALGLSPSGVLQTGGSATPNVSAAATPRLNNANQRLNRQTSIANSLIGMAGRMAASGIYGGAISSVKASASKAASMAAHSAPLALDIDMSPKAVQDRIDFFKD